VGAFNRLSTGNQEKFLLWFNFYLIFPVGLTIVIHYNTGKTTMQPERKEIKGNT
jgi:hypothetical protein